MHNWLQSITYLMIEANSSCNLKCTSCSRERLVNEGMRNPANISEKDFRFLLNQLVNSPIDTIKFEGISEPFLHPQFANLTDVVREYFPQAHLIIITNLQYNIEKLNFDKILENTSSLYISIDGVGSLFEEIRTGAKWTVMLKNLEYISLNFSDQIKQKIYINFTASEKNYLELPKMYELKKKFGLGGVRINLMQNWEEDKLNPNSFNKEFLEFLKQYAQDLKGVGSWDYKDCFWPFNGIVIDVEGNVRQCVLNTTQKPIGNAFQTPLHELYNGKFYSSLRQSLSNNHAQKSCEMCDYKLLSPHILEIQSERVNISPRKKIFKN